MKYWCEPVPRGDRTEITEDEFHRLSEAWRRTLVFLAIEEKFNLLLENYAEFETELHRITLDSMLHLHWTWASLTTDVYAVNRRLANFLMVTRLYLDQAGHDISRMYGRDSDVSSAWCKATNEQYDRSFGYRLMSAVRNYSQHGGLPINSLRVNHEADRSRPAPFPIRLTIQAYVRVSDLEMEKKVKRAVVEELRATGEEVGIIAYVREFLGALATVHQAFRQHVQKDRDDALKCLNEAVGRYSGSATLRAVKTFPTDDDSQDVDEGAIIFADLPEKLEFLIRRNSHLDGLPRRYVSGEV